jgi:hypothetical protein
LETSLVDQREASRIRNPFAVRVQGLGAAGETFDEQTVLDNLSSGGAYLRLSQSVEPGTDLAITVQFAGAPINNHLYPGFLAQGEVVRSEPQAGGACGVAVKFHRRRFVYRAGPYVKH